MPTKKTRSASKDKTEPSIARETNSPFAPETDGKIFEAYPWLASILPPSRRCKIRILMVADGTLDFGSGDTGLSEVLTKALNTSSLPWADYEITTAHRTNGSAQIQNYRFDAALPSPYGGPLSRKHYDVVLLFGFENEFFADFGVTRNPLALSQSELKHIFTFMNEGGGLFATGDHDELGSALCATIPRVRTMRLWYNTFNSHPETTPPAPPALGPTRLDTLRPGADGTFQFTDQSDDVPQTILPKYYPNPSGTASYPHPLLAYGNSAVTVLPDHMHTGEIVVPSNLTNTYSFDGTPASDEYPTLPGEETRLAPEIVAISVTAGGYLTDMDQPPVIPRCYGAIGAYDGHRVGLGRVVVDESWHLWLNINLKGTNATNPPKHGFYDSMNQPTAIYQVIKQYYRNVVNYLRPSSLNPCWTFGLLLFVRYTLPLLEELRPVKEPSLGDILEAGVAVRKAIATYLSDAEAMSCAIALLDESPEESRVAIRGMIDPWSSDRGRKNSHLMFNSEIALYTILGGAIYAIAGNLPQSPDRAAQALEKMELDEKRAAQVLYDGVNLGVEILAKHMEDSSNMFRQRSATIRARK